MSDFGPYQLEHELGRGAHAVVYRAFDPRAQRHVALKVLLAGDPRRLAREAQLTAALRHPGIVAIHDLGHAHGRGYIAYELVDGARDLRQAWANADLPQRVDWVLQAAHALGAAHAQGIVHRDVKPENLLVTHDGHVKVADFGVAWTRAQERLTQTGGVVGTPTHMAPEQWSGAAIGPAADVWALGVILYEALTDTLPFQGDSWTELADAVQRARPAPPRLPRDAPAHWARACLRALDPDPERRPSDGAAFAQTLTQPARRRVPWVWVAVGGVAALSVGAWVWRPKLAEPSTTQPVETPDDWATRTQRLWDDGAWEEAREVVAAWRAEAPSDEATEWWVRLLHRSGGAEEAEQFLRAVVEGRSSARLWVVLARLRYDRGDFAGCVEAGERAQALAPSSADAWVEIGAGHRKLGQLELAIEALEHAVTLNPEGPRGWIELGLCRIVGGDPAAARDCYTRAIDVRPEHPRAYRERSAAWLQLGEEERAFADMREVAKWETDPRGRRFAEGLVLAQEERNAEALEVFTALSEEVPDEVDVWLNRALNEVQVGRYEAALRSLGEAERRNPRAKGLAETRGVALLKLGRTEEATRSLEEAVALEPRDLRARLSLVTAYKRLQRTERLWEQAEEIEALAPGHPEVALLRAQVWLQRGRPDDAERVLQAALEEGEENSALLFLLGGARMLQGQVREAERVFTRGLALDPSSLNALSNRGLVRSRLGDVPGAIADYRRALELDPDAVSVLVNYGLLLNTRGRFAEALPLLDQALRLQPNHRNAYFLRGRARAETGELPGARDDFQRAFVGEPSDREAMLLFVAVCQRLGAQAHAQQVLSEVVGRLPPGPVRTQIETTLAQLAGEAN